MKSIEEVKGRCFIDDEGHWLWRGGLNATDKNPKIWAPDYARGGVMRNQTGGRAVYNLSTGQAIPNRWSVVTTCLVKLCVNPDHQKCLSRPNMGRFYAAKGVFKNSISRKLANRRINTARRKLTNELREVIDSNPQLSGSVLGAKLGVSKNAINTYRRNKRNGAMPSLGMFSGLIAANDAARRRA